MSSREHSWHFDTQCKDKPEHMWRADSAQTRSSSAHHAAKNKKLLDAPPSPRPLPLAHLRVNLVNHEVDWDFLNQWPPVMQKKVKLYIFLKKKYKSISWQKKHIIAKKKKKLAILDIKIALKLFYLINVGYKNKKKHWSEHLTKIIKHLLLQVNTRKSFLFLNQLHMRAVLSRWQSAFPWTVCNYWCVPYAATL